MGICCMAQETQTGALYQLRRVRWGERWEAVSKERGYMYTLPKLFKQQIPQQQNQDNVDVMKLL